MIHDLKTLMNEDGDYFYDFYISGNLYQYHIKQKKLRCRRVGSSGIWWSIIDKRHQDRVERSMHKYFRKEKLKRICNILEKK